MIVEENQILTDKEIQEKIEAHPCYNKGAHDKYARIHLPVAPACNIQCNYCNRKYDCSNESRPGVTSDVLTPEQALERVINAKQKLPNLSVVGIAGPGDALANPGATFATFDLIKTYDPELILCLSTNGLNLVHYVDQIHDAGVGHVTVTLNTVNTSVAADIYSWVQHEGVTYYGEEGAAILLERQLEGIRMLVERGILVKVNSVLIPGFNDTHILEVAKTIKQMGVFIHNIIPLLSKPEYGTYFSQLGIMEPDCAMIGKVQLDCAEAMGGFDHVMQHCRQCRADAVGILGKDIDINEQTQEEIMKTAIEKERVFNQQRHNVIVEVEKDIVDGQCYMDRSSSVLVAVATENSRHVDVSFHNSRIFYIYEVSCWGAHLLEIRKLSYEQTTACIKISGHLKAVQELISDCSILSCSKVGKQAVKELGKVDILLNESEAYGVLDQVAWTLAKPYLMSNTYATACA